MTARLDLRVAFNKALRFKLPVIVAALSVALGVVVAVRFGRPLVDTVTAWLTLLGTLALALPAIRLNEQGKQLTSLKTLITGIAAEEERLAKLDRESEDYRKGEADLKDRRARLTRRERDLGEAQGAWTPAAHRLLYIGYGLILGAAIVAVLKPVL